ncbi:MAG: histidine phosphatase family protein [bacterium]|jgi:phosphohistidine phosphatase|nr:histidine phosphatase family protein [bacterium]
MELYFIRHAIAVDRLDPQVKNDEQRWLTDAGIEKMEKAARGFAKLVKPLDAIYTSHYVRAKQTAEIVRRMLSSSGPLITTSNLAPGVGFDAFLDLCLEAKADARLAFVGHEPDMSGLIAKLISAGSAVVEMKKGAICRVDVPGAPAVQRGVLIWLLPPKTLRALA